MEKLPTQLEAGLKRFEEKEETPAKMLTQLEAGLKRFDETEAKVNEVAQEAENTINNQEKEVADNPNAQVEDIEKAVEYTNEARKGIGEARVQISDNILGTPTTIQRLPDLILNQKNIEEAFRIGKPIEVKIRIDSGDIEEGWTIKSIINDKVFVIKEDKNGHIITKSVPLEELKQLNTPALGKEDAK